MRPIQVPFAFLTPLLIIGILFNNLYKCPENAAYFILLLLLIFSMLYIWIRSLIKLGLGSILLFIVTFSFILLGYFSSQLDWQLSKPKITEDALAKIRYYSVRIDSKPEQATNTTRYEVVINKIKINEDWKLLQAKAILYSKQTEVFHYGQEIVIKGNPVFLEKQKNPHAFDYSLFLQRKGIYLQTFCNKENYQISSTDHSKSIRYLTLRIGDYFENILAKYIKLDRELNMVRAMVIGRRNEITPEMEYAYEATGTSHILAVSGLHVGIIYMVIAFLFQFTKRKGWKWLYYTFLIFSIWSFAFITGLSPSVRRAAIMFTFIIVAEMINRKKNIYNVILSSAFCILLFSPNMIFSVSFQFSYMAVLGIVFLYKKIYNLLYVKNSFLNFFWQITALSFSVQIATFAINIYYFHHFPALFPITNLFAIPTALVVVGGSLALFFTSFIEFFAGIIGLIIEKWVFCYNEIMTWLSGLSFTSIEDLSIKGIYVFLILLMVYFLIRFIDKKRVPYFSAFTFLIVLTAIVVILDRYQSAIQKKLFVYAVNDHFIIDVFQGNSCFSNTTHSNETDPDILFNIKPNRDYHLIESISSMDNLPIAESFGKNRILVLGDYTFLILKEPFHVSKSDHQQEIDFLIVGQSSIGLLKSILQYISVRKVIFDNTLNIRQVESARKYIPNHIPLHVIDEQGAFKIDI